MEINQMLDGKQTAKDLGFQVRQDLLEGQRGGMWGEEVDYSGCGPEFTRTTSRDRNALSLLEKLDQTEIPVVLREVWKPYVTQAG